MSEDLAVRKPFRKLARSDFSSFPVWEWASDEEGVEGQDESWVRPTPHQHIPRSAFAQYLVSAVALLRDGSTLPACVEVTVSGKKLNFAPSFVFLLDRHLDFVSMETNRLLSRYTKQVENRPTHWELAVPLEGEKKLRKRKVQVSHAFTLAVEFLTALEARSKARQAKKDKDA